MVSDGAGKVPPVGELVPGDQAHQVRTGELAERQLDRLLEDADGLERGQRTSDAVVVAGKEVAGDVVLVRDLIAACP